METRSDILVHFVQVSSGQKRLSGWGLREDAGPGSARSPWVAGGGRIRLYSTRIILVYQSAVGEENKKSRKKTRLTAAAAGVTRHVRFFEETGKSHSSRARPLIEVSALVSVPWLCLKCDRVNFTRMNFGEKPLWSTCALPDSPYNLIPLAFPSLRGFFLPHPRFTCRAAINFRSQKSERLIH